MKKRVNRLLALLLAAALSFCTISCGAGQTPQAKEDEHQRFTEFSEELFCSELLENTINLHYILAYPENYGIDDYEVVLPTVSTDSEKKNYTASREVLKELQSFDYKLLPADDQLTYDVLKEYLETSLEGEDFYYFDEPFSPIMGFQANLSITLAEYTFRREQDVQDYLKLLELIPAYVDSLITLEKTRSQMGYAMPDTTIDDVFDSVQEFINSGDNNIFLTSFEERLEGLADLSDKKRADYISRNQDILNNQIIPSYKKIGRCLQEVRGTAENVQGLCHTEGGSDYYAYLLKSMVGSGHSPEEILALVEDQIQQDLTEMMMIMSSSPELLESFDGSIPEDRTPEEILEYLAEAMREDYPELPVEAAYQIKYVPEYMEESTSPAFYLTPPYDLPNENTIYINNSSTDESSLFSTLAHEGYPGHLYQMVYASATFSNPIRSLLSYLGYSEGWGLYVEHESYGMNDKLTSQSENIAALYRLNSSVSIAVHALVDLKVHYEGCSQEEIRTLLYTYFGELDGEAVQELYDLIVSEPAYYLKYYGGYLEFLLLREKAEDQLEEKFDLKEFHKFLLDMGPCAFPTIEAYMDDWIEEQK
ncbi:MAG: DUF885 domain-containing protein [Lachnospiraceae bacterium]|jgi:uncharacterized protein (DUF885 family)|nr:DUF885 domain-containing protein [Lachnospiraceae bacterium]